MKNYPIKIISSGQTRTDRTALDVAKNKMIFIGIGMGILFWILESMIDAFIWHEGNLIDQILAPDPNEIWMRLIVICILIISPFYILLIMSTAFDLLFTLNIS